MEDSKHKMGNVATLRLFRLLRIFRAARAVRLVQYLRQLRLMLYSVVSCLVSMFWAVLLLLIFMCLYALYLQDTSLAYLKETWFQINNSGGPPSPEMKKEFGSVMEQLGEHWNGMGYAVCSLVYSISGGADWGDLAEPFWTIRGGSGISYIVFVILTIFGLLNILVGIFVKEAEEISKWDHDFVVDGFITKKKQKEEEISNLFDIMDTESNGELSLKELSDALDNPKIQAQFALLEVEVEKVGVLFHIMDVDGDCSITKGEFVQGLAKLHGNANATDVADLLIEEQKLNKKLDSLQNHISQRIDSLQDKLVTPGYHGGGHTPLASREFQGQAGGWNAWHGHPSPQRY